jgi:hypothetical protein
MTRRVKNKYKKIKLIMNNIFLLLIMLFFVPVMAMNLPLHDNTMPITLSECVYSHKTTYAHELRTQITTNNNNNFPSLSINKIKYNRLGYLIIKIMAPQDTLNANNTTQNPCIEQLKLGYFDEKDIKTLRNDIRAAKNKNKNEENISITIIEPCAPKVGQSRTPQPHVAHLINKKIDLNKEYIALILNEKSWWTFLKNGADSTIWIIGLFTTSGLILWLCEYIQLLR